MTDEFDASPHNPREERFRPMGEFLLAELIAVVILAAVTLVAGEQGAGASGAGMIALLVVIPVVRVVWLAGRWYIRRDLKYAAVATFVVFVVVTGFFLSR